MIVTQNAPFDFLKCCHLPPNCSCCYVAPCDLYSRGCGNICCYSVTANISWKLQNCENIAVMQPLKICLSYAMSHKYMRAKTKQRAFLQMIYNWKYILSQCCELHLLFSCGTNTVCIWRDHGVALHLFTFGFAHILNSTFYVSLRVWRFGFDGCPVRFHRGAAPLHIRAEFSQQWRPVVSRRQLRTLRH